MESKPTLGYTERMKKRTEKIYHYDVMFRPNGDGYTVTVPAIPEIVTEGSTITEARMMAKDAIRCVLEAALKEKVPISGTGRRTHRKRIAVSV